MQNNIAIFNLPVKLTAAVNHYTFVNIAGANSAAGTYALGVAQTDGVIGDMVTVDVIGTVQIVAGGVIAVGAQIEVGANGKGITKASGVVVARALEAAAAADDIIEVLLIPS